MSDHRDPFLAEQMNQLDPPDHRPDFWSRLEHDLAEQTSARRVLSDRWWSTPRLLSVAAAVILMAGAVVGVIIASGDGSSELETGPGPAGTPSAPGGTEPGPGTTDPSGGDGTAGGGGTASDDETSASTTTAPTPMNLDGAVQLDVSRDGALALYAVPDAGASGCEATDGWRLYWIDDADAGQLAADDVLSNVPEISAGDRGARSFLDRCEESTTLYVTTEVEPGTLEGLREVEPVGWETSVILETGWSGRILVLEVSRPAGGGDAERFRLQVDPETGEVLDSEPLDGAATPGSCSAASLSDPRLSSGQPWSPLAAQIQQAALDCDYERLAELAGSSFTFSFGSSTDFAAFLLDGEASGFDPTRKLVLLLEADPGDLPDQPYLSWPAFTACEETCGIDDAEVRRLGYTEAELAAFREFGSYIGYRVLFLDNGDGSYTWSVFTAGD